MDSVERGESFVVTRDGRGIGELIPLRRNRRFVPRADFVFSSTLAASVDIERLRAEQDAVFDQAIDDPYTR